MMQQLAVFTAATLATLALSIIFTTVAIGILETVRHKDREASWLRKEEDR
jgi:hypothetical protein